MDNRVILKIEDNTISRLAGNQYGRKLYDEQVKKYFSPGEELIIVFPETIKDVAVSFIQGFFKEIVDTIGLQKASAQIKIEGTERVKARIGENL